MKQEEEYTLVYGLSADPVHQMHVDVVTGSAQELILRGYAITRIVIVPVFRRNPVGDREKDAPAADFEDRFAMCRMAARKIGHGLGPRLGELSSRVYVSNIEQQLAQDRETPNYTAETLEALQSEDAAAGGWIFLMGSDLVSGGDPELQHWHRPEKLIQLAIIAIYPRPGYPANAHFLGWLEQQGARFELLDGVKQSEGSASQVRRLLEDGQDPLALCQDGLLPEAVALYIKERSLYSKIG